MAGDGGFLASCGPAHPFHEPGSTSGRLELLVLDDLLEPALQEEVGGATDTIGAARSMARLCTGSRSLWAPSAFCRTMARSTSPS
jgi:hypothetical protein